MTEQSPPNPAVSRQFFNNCQCGSFRASSAAAGWLASSMTPPGRGDPLKGELFSKEWHTTGCATVLGWPGAEAGLGL